ncbi:MAG TPA: hypothetical protein VF202_09575 [Trueperaceae bacterium]
MIIDVLRRSQAEPPSLDEATGAVTWYGRRGKPIAYTLKQGDCCWFRLVGLASYRFPLSAPDGVLRCEAVPEPGAEWDEVVDHYYRSLSVLALEAYGYESVHGSALLTPAGALVLTAPSGAGKTTLALSLASRGHELIADDAVVLDPAPAEHPARPALRPLPFVPRARDETAARFGLPVRARLPEPAGPVGLGAPVPLAAFVLLRRAGAEEVGARTGLERLSPGQAFTALLGRAYFHAPHEAARDRQAVASYLKLTARVPVYRLTYRDGFDRLEEAVAALERLVADLAPAGQGAAGRV